MAIQDCGYIPAQDLKDALRSISLSVENIQGQVDFEMENCREILMWTSPLYKHIADQAPCAFKTIAALTAFRCAGGEVTGIQGDWPIDFSPPAQDFDLGWFTTSQKICKLRGNLELKKGELEHATLWLKEVFPFAGPLRVFFEGAYVALKDLEPHLEKALSSQSG